MDNHLQELYDLLNYNSDDKTLNNSSIINYLVTDLCQNSSPEKGLCFSKEDFNLINKIKEFNYKNIYFSDRIQHSMRFFDIVINEIYNTLKSCFDKENTLNNIKNLKKFYPKLSNEFYHFLENYCDFGNREKFKNSLVFDIQTQEDYYHSILTYISGMTDNFAIEIYNEIIGF